uniref:Uncharacterized protein n=1 Tax=Schistocephalus solidus TaxID=70667 RepID=A0A0X3PN26_SCHSO
MRPRPIRTRQMEKANISIKRALERRFTSCRRFLSILLSLYLLVHKIQTGIRYDKDAESHHSARCWSWHLPALFHSCRSAIKLELWHHPALLSEFASEGVLSDCGSPPCLRHFGKPRCPRNYHCQLRNRKILGHASRPRTDLAWRHLSLGCNRILLCQVGFNILSSAGCHRNDLRTGDGNYYKYCNDT